MVPRELDAMAKIQLGPRQDRCCPQQTSSPGLVMSSFQCAWDSWVLRPYGGRGGNGPVVLPKHPSRKISGIPCPLKTNKERVSEAFDRRTNAVLHWAGDPGDRVGSGGGLG